jgi:hypothetical protein
MTNIAVPDVTLVSSATGDSVLGVQSGVVKRFALNALNTSYTPSGTGGVLRSYKSKVEELGRSVVDFGADPTGVADSTTAFNNAIAACKIILLPPGTYKVGALNVNKQVWLIGAGRYTTTLNSTVTGSAHGMTIIGDGALGGAQAIRMSGFKLAYTGAGQTAASGTNNCWSGIYIQRKVIMDEVWVDNFTNDGMYFAPNDASEGATSTSGTIGNAVFFSMMTNCWSKHNGRDGIRVRMGANANGFINCDWSNNGAVGFHHLTDGGATYGNWGIGGQASYNASYGWYFESGTEAIFSSLYAEKNGSVDSGNTGYTNTPFDFYIGDNLSRSSIGLGVVFNASSTHVRAPSKGLNDSIIVWRGGTRFFSSTGSQMPYLGATITNSTATTVAGIVSDYNALLAALRSCNVIQ